MTERPKQAAIFVAPAGCTRAAPLRDARSHNPRWLGSAPAFAKKNGPNSGGTSADVLVIWKNDGPKKKAEAIVHSPIWPFFGDQNKNGVPQP